jgi:hypothetical protein
MHSIEAWCPHLSFARLPRLTAPLGGSPGLGRAYPGDTAGFHRPTPRTRWPGASRSPISLHVPPNQASGLIPFVLRVPPDQASGRVLLSPACAPTLRCRAWSRSPLDQDAQSTYGLRMSLRLAKAAESLMTPVCQPIGAAPLLGTGVEVEVTGPLSIV